MRIMNRASAGISLGPRKMNASKTMLRSGLLLVVMGHMSVQAETNEEWGRRLSRNLQAFREQINKQKQIPQRPASVQTIDSNGRNHPIGLWDDVKRTRDRTSSDNISQGAAPSTPVQQPEVQADAALARGDYDEALRLLELARVQSPHNAALIPRINAVRSAKLANEVREVNVRRGVELSRVLGRAEQSLPAQLRSPAPTVALANVAREPLTDAAVIDLRGVQYLVVDPAFFKPAAAGGSLNTQGVRRFIEPPEPGKTLSPVAFAGSPYAAVFESREFETLMLGGLRTDPAQEPGGLHRAREAFLRKVDALPPQSIHVVTTASDEELRASQLKVKAAYQDYRKRRKALLGAAANSSLRAMRSMLEGMENEGWFKPGDNLAAKAGTDPFLKATMDERARVVRWYAELYLDEAEDRAYRELAARVTRIMKEDDKS